MFSRILMAFLALVFAGVSLGLGSCANREIRRKQLLDRVPVSRVTAILPGPAAVSGIVRAAEQTLQGPYTGIPCVYYRKIYKVKSGKNWSTREDREESIPFWLEDDSGRLLVNPALRDVQGIEVHSVVAGSQHTIEYAIRPGDPVFVFGRSDGQGFPLDESMPSVVTAHGRSDYQGARGMGGLLGCLAATTAASLSIYFLCLAFGAHRIFTYLFLIAAVIPTWLFVQWMTLTAAELRESSRFLGVARAAAESGESGSLRSALLKRTYNEAAARHNLFRGKFPNSLVAGAEGVPAAPMIAIPKPEEDLAARHPAEPPPVSSLHPGFGVLFIGGGALLAALFTWFGFRSLKLKQVIENLPTSPAAGVVWGLSELKGTARLAEKRVRAEYTGGECSWYLCTTQEQRKQGKNTTWVEIHRATEGVPFWLEDRSGRVLVHPEGAKISADKTMTERVGKIRREEWQIRDGSVLYILGPAGLAGDDDDRLSIRKSPDEPDYLVTVESEEKVKMSYASQGFLLLNFAMNAVTLLVLGALALAEFSSFDFFVAGFVPPIFLAGLVAVFHYNDLQFVEERMRRSKGMIDVALEKRATLVPNLVAVVKAYLDHEKQLQTAFAGMRAKAVTAAAADLKAVIERYPDLKGNQTALDLQKRLTALENEIAHAREGYNDAVERYNTAIATFPDLFLARLAGMKEAQPLAP